MKDTIAIFASARRDGNTGKFMDWIARELDIEVINLIDKNISSYDYEYKNQDDDFIPLMKELLNYENIIFSTPIYWNYACAQMKVFLDRNYDYIDQQQYNDIRQNIKGKTAFIVCTSMSDNPNKSFLDSFKASLEFMGMRFGGHVHANCEKGYLPENYSEDVNRFVAHLNNINHIN